MRVVHKGPEGTRTLASDVETADSAVARGIGLMFRRSVPEDYALVFPFRRAATRRLHMVCVPFDVDAVWTVDGEVTTVTRLSEPGNASARPNGREEGSATAG